MERSASRWWIISVCLSLVVRAQIPENELTPVQTQAVRLVMEDFHKRDYIQNGFHVSSISHATETLFSSGIFVHLEFTLKPTTCKKRQWMESTCKIVNSKRVFNCFTCMKFRHGSHEVMSELKDCTLHHHVNTERTSERKKSCSQVKRNGETGLHLPGSFSFLKTQ
ncbi:retinoic acid receptor responder protein 2 [Pelodytes ibericus]